MAVSTQVNGLAVPATEPSIAYSSVNAKARSQLSITRHLGNRLPGSATFDRDALYAELAPLVRRLIRQYGQTTELRQDLAGEIYCRFCALLQAYDPQRGVPLRPYLIRQLTAATYTYARQQWRVQKREIGWDEESVERVPAATADPTSAWIEALSEQQMLASLPQAMQQLPQRQRQIVIWRYYEERSFEEMATVLGIQTATVRSLLRHGLNKMRSLLASTEEIA